VLSLGGDPLPLLTADDPVLLGLLIHTTERGAEISVSRDRARFEALARMFGAKKRG
jgi:hypothetical protein